MWEAAPDSRFQPLRASRVNQSRLGLLFSMPLREDLTPLWWIVGCASSRLCVLCRFTAPFDQRIWIAFYVLEHMDMDMLLSPSSSTLISYYYVLISLRIRHPPNVIDGWCSVHDTLRRLVNQWISISQHSPEKPNPLPLRGQVLLVRF